MYGEAAKLGRLRAKWLLAEKAILAEHRSQFPPGWGQCRSVLVEKPLDGCTNAISAAGVGPFSLDDQSAQNDLQRVDARRGVFQRVNSFLVHVLTLLRLRKPNARIDSIQSQADLEWPRAVPRPRSPNKKKEAA